jgi:integrase
MSAPVKLPSGRWRARWFDHQGKRRSATFASEAACRSAMARAHVERDDIQSGRARPRASTTIAELVEPWLELRPPGRLRDNRRHFEHHILPAMGSLKLGQVTPEVIVSFTRQLEATKSARRGEINAEGRTLKPASVANILITLRKFMNDHEHHVRIRYRIPTSGYGWIREAAQVAMFLRELGTGWLRMACELAVHAGLRKGEVAGLRRDGLDFAQGIIRVDRSYDGPTKSKRVRWVPMSPQLATSLRAWVLAHPGELVVTRDGNPITEETDLAQSVRRACKRAGVPEVNYHQLRHTFASHAATRVALPLVGAVLGHADPKTTMRYAHLDSESVARDARLHLVFEAPAGDVTPLKPAEATGHVVATSDAARSSRVGKSA